MKLYDEEIENLYMELKKYHEQYLKKFNVKLPRLKTRDKFTKNALVLVYLFNKFEEPVTKEELTYFLSLYDERSNDVQQGRHLGQQSGWFIITGTRNDEQCEKYNVKYGEYALISVKEYYPEFKHLKREVNITDDEWNNLKKEYNNKCATCGSIEGEKNFHYPNIITSLQKGHMNPNEELKLGNIIPQCSECNRQDRNYFIYNKKGRVVKIANPSFVLKSDEKTKKEMLKILNHEFDK